MDFSFITKLRVVTLIFTIFSSSLYATTLKVNVLEKGTGEPLEGATVVIEGTDEYDETNRQGSVNFSDVSLPAKLKILYMGFDTQEKVVTQSVNTIYLVPISVEGDVLEVVAERVVEKNSKIVISSEELRRAPGSAGDPLKTIQSMPGVVTAAEGLGVVYIRGSEPNQNITRVNRARIGYLYHFGGLHSTISPQVVSDFNMFLGGFPVEYGDALGGALDIKLRKPKRDRLHQNYSIGTYEASAFLEGPLFKENGKDSAYFSARRSYVDLVLSNEAFGDLLNSDNNGETENSVTQVPRFYDVQGVWQHDLRNGRLLFQHFSAKDSIKLVLNTPEKSDPDAVGGLESSTEFHSSSFVWEQMWSKNLNTSSVMYLISTKEKLRIGKDENNEPYFLNISEVDAIWQPEVRWGFDESTLLTAGTEFIYARTPVDAKISRPPEFNDVDYNLTELQKFRIDKTYHAGLINPYVKIRKKWFNRLTTQIGARLQYIRSDARNPIHAISPRSSFEYEFTKNTTFTGSWGRYVQLPDPGQFVREAGNPDLLNLDSEHRILGVRHKINDKWNLQFETFHKPMKNLVVTYDDRLAPNNYDNEGTGEAFGFDVLIKREYSGKKMGWLSYSALRSTRTEKGVTAPFVGDQRHTFTAVWSQPMGGSWKDWVAGFRLRLNSGRPYTKAIGRVGKCVDNNDEFVDCVDNENSEVDPTFSHWKLLKGSLNGARLPYFFQLDIRMDKEVLYNTWKLNYYIDILNILNTRNIAGYDYGESFEKVDDPIATRSLGIFPSFGVEAKF